jgi:hypothetical protein
MSNSLTPPVTLSYAPPARGNNIWIRYIVYVAVWQVVFLGLLAILVLVVPRFLEVFKDFKTSLPLLTWCVLLFADFVANQFGWVLMLLAPFVVPLPTLWLGRMGDTLLARKLRAVYRAGIIVMALAVFSAIPIIVVSLFLPLVKLIHSVSGGAPAGGGP